VWQGAFDGKPNGLRRRRLRRSGGLGPPGALWPSTSMGHDSLRENGPEAPAEKVALFGGYCPGAWRPPIPIPAESVCANHGLNLFRMFYAPESARFRLPMPGERVPDFSWMPVTHGFLIPIRHGGLEFGVIELEGAEFLDSNQSYPREAQAIASLIALTMSNARSYQELEHEIRRRECAEPREREGRLAAEAGNRAKSQFRVDVSWISPKSRRASWSWGFWILICEPCWRWSGGCCGPRPGRKV
jgi:hypothetical protein